MPTSPLLVVALAGPAAPVVSDCIAEYRRWAELAASRMEGACLRTDSEVMAWEALRTAAAVTIASVLADPRTVVALTPPTAPRHTDSVSDERPARSASVALSRMLAQIDEDGGAAR